jgi:PhzF family phenazine biosynthesis protein
VALRTLDFQILNVFAETRFGGNPLAVIEDATALREDELMPLCQQFNLSETTFIFPPMSGGAARVRIFSPDGEMPFAGHPTLGTSQVVRKVRSAGEAFSLELPVGNIPVSAEGDRWELRANAGTTRAPAADDALAAMLGLETAAVLPGARWVNTGTEQLLIPLRDVEALRVAAPDIEGLSRCGTNAAGRANVSLFVLDDARVTSRYFWAHRREVREDPARVRPARTWGRGCSSAATRGPPSGSSSRATRPAG